MRISLGRVAVAVALMSTLLSAAPALGAADTRPVLSNQDWEAPIVVTNEIHASGTQGILDADPKGLVPKATFVKRYSLDTDHWEVWLCGDVSNNMATVIADLEAATVDYYGAISGGLYTPDFSAGGTIPNPPGETLSGSDCLDLFDAGTYSTVGSPEGLFIVDAVTGGGYASPGVTCGGTGTDCPTISSTWPNNGRYAVVGQNMVSNYPSVVAHELGHTLQWPHSYSGLTSSEYDNPIDVMSGNYKDLGTSWTEEDPYATLSFNRYQSGWVSAADVVVASGDYQSMTLQPFNVSGTQLLAVKTETDGQFYAFGARKRSTYDPIPAGWEGVEVYFVDHLCSVTFFDGICPGLWREHHQEPPNQYQIDHVLTPGDSIELEGITITVTGSTATGFTIEADGDPGSTSAPGAPTTPDSSVSDSSATITWTEPGDGGSAITGYDLETENQTTGGSSVANVGLTLSETVTGLTNGHDYRARVRARNTIGDGSWSAWSSSFTPSTVPSAPGAPSATAGDAVAVVTWSAPTSDGGADIAEYSVEVNNLTLESSNYIATGVVTGFVVTGLVNDDVYRFRVQAANATGSSSWSTWSSSVVPVAGAEPPPPPPDPPSPPTPPDPIDTFVDDDNSIFEDDIEWLAAAGITKGCNPPSNDRFCPDAPVTRGQMAAFLVRALGLTDIDTVDFIDDDNSQFETAIEALATSGITKGCNAAGTRFCPNANVTRGEMAAFLVRALGLTDRGAVDFSDDNQSIFEADIERIATAGITTGCNQAGTSFCPDDSVTRGQMAAFLRRALG